MKNLFSLLLSALLLVAFTTASHESKAQIVKPIAASKTTLTAPDTATISLDVDAAAKSAEVLVTKTSGTVAGTATLQGTVDGTNYEAIGSALTLANQASNYKIWDLHASTGKKIYAKYRVLVITSGTNVVTNKGYLLKRND